MTDRRFAWTQISAYVDGESDKAVAAEIAAAAAADPRVAEAVAAVRRLQEASRAAMMPESRDVPALPARPAPPAGPIAGRLRPHFRALAASLLAAFMFAASLVWLLPRPDVSVESWVASARDQHASWLASAPDAAGGIGGTASDFAEINLPGTVGYVPDLTVARMRVVHVAVDPRDARTLFVGYVGRNGCRLGLRIAAAPDALPAALAIGRDASGRTSATWAVGGTGYAAVAQGMDDGRFRAVAHFLEGVTRQAPQAREPVRTATRIPGADAPCLG